MGKPQVCCTGQFAQGIHLSEVTNYGERRRVRITALVFRVGRHPGDTEIEHGESASFRMDFATRVVAMRKDVLRDVPEKDCKTARASIVASVGQEEVVRVDRVVLDKVRPEADTVWPQMDLPDRRCAAP